MCQHNQHVGSTFLPDIFAIDDVLFEKGTSMAEEVAEKVSIYFGEGDAERKCYRRGKSEYTVDKSCIR
jgi:hypothetical protein